MEQEIKSQKQLWVKPQITEIEVKMTATNDNFEGNNGKHGAYNDGNGPDSGS